MKMLRGVAVVAAFVLVLTACGDDSSDEGSATGSSAESTTTTAAAAVEPLQVLVTNDDGIGAEGIDALVNALSERSDVEVTVVAPAEQQSGKSDETSPTPPPAEPATTISGVEAIAVDGFPADATNHGLSGEVGIDFDLVISGVNDGANLGVARNGSGTVGAAATAARAGVAALAASLGSPGDAEVYGMSAGVEQTMAWLDEHIDMIAAGQMAGTLEILNVPTCPAGEVRGVIEVPSNDDNSPLEETDCTSTLEDPVDDLEAFANGFAALSQLDPAATGLSVQ
jgi:5'-nucleotidase